MADKSIDDLVNEGYELVQKTEDLPPKDVRELLKQYGRPALEGVMIGILFSGAELILRTLDIQYQWPKVEFPGLTALVGSFGMTYALNKISNWWSEVYNSRQNNRTLDKITKTIFIITQNEEDSYKYSVKSFSAYTTISYIGFKFFS